MQKKILIGICDIGMGHLNRQICIINELLKYNVDLVLTCTDKNEKMLNTMFPNINKVKINIPWIACDSNGLDFSKCLEIYNNSDKKDYYADFLKFCINVEDYFNGPPDYVFTDYEPNVAKYAYARDLTLIGMEQHSKFLFLDEYGINEEKSRLKFFFPKVDYRIISSFFPIKDIPNTLLLSPIVNTNTDDVEDQDFILVYFSPYVQDKSFFNGIFELMNNDKNNNYKVYTKFDFKSTDRIQIKPFSNEFKEDLRKCKCLISTAGHQLISEAIYLDKPLYMLPIKTFEQNYSNYMVKKYGLGMDINDDYQDFLNSINDIKNNMVEYKKKYWKHDWDELLNDFFSNSLNLERSEKNEISKVIKK